MPLHPNADFLDPKFFKWLLTHDAIDEVSALSRHFSRAILTNPGQEMCEPVEAGEHLMLNLTFPAIVKIV